MSELNGQRRDPSLEGPVRIVYHAENRTFARLFNERSLDEVKDVVRRKLGLGRDTDVSLKQMGVNALLDLEDNDDFQAFCILLKSSDSVNIQVTAGKSQGAAVSPPIALQSRENKSVSEPLLPSHPEEPAIPLQPEVATTTKASTATKKTRESSTRKHRVSFSGADLETSGKPAEKRGRSKSTTGTVASSVETPETPATAELTEGPPKKKRKQVKPKAVESTPAEAPDSPKAEVTKPARVYRKSKAASKNIETSDQPAKKPRKKKEKQPEPIEADDTDIPDLGNEASLRTAAGKAEKLSVKGSKSRTEKEVVPTLCASIPQTSACTDLLCEVAAAIRNTVRRITAESFTSSTPALESATFSRASASEISAAPTEHKLEAVVPTGRPPQQTLELNGPSCPICLEVPFHIRYCCPIVQKGSDAIRERLDELKRSNNNGQESLIKELEDLLRDSKVTSKPSASTDVIQSRQVSQTPDALVSRTSNVPSNSYLSEVTVETKNEGSSSESSDDASQGGAEPKGLTACRGQETSGEQLSLPNDDLEAVIRGPMSRRQSVLGVLDRILDRGDDSDSEGDTDELEEDLDEGTDRSIRRLSKCIARSSDSKSEGESGSLLSSRFDENASNDLESSMHDSNKAATKSVEHDDDDTVARNSHDPPVFKGQSGDSSEETHVGSQDLMVVDEAIGEKGTNVSVEEQLSPPVPQVPVPQLLNVPIKEPQVPEGTAIDPTPGQGRDLEAADPDPIEPADEIEPRNVACLSNPDFIEAPEDVGTSFAGVIQSTPTPGVARRLKTRHGEILDDEAEQPVLLDQLSLAVPLSAKRKSRKKDMEMKNQEPTTTRKSSRLNPLPPAASTPAIVSCFKQRAKATSAKTPAKRSEGRSDALQNSARDDVTRNGACTAATPSIRWETLPDPTSSPPIQPDEPSVLLDELTPSSPHLESNRVLKRPNTRGKKVQSHTSQEGSFQEGQRLFDLTPSQIPFPYSQHKNPISTMLANEQEEEVTTDSEEDQKVARKKPKLSAPYRPLSQLASQTTLYSRSLTTPTTNKMTNGKANKRAAAEDSSSSSSSSEEEADESAHIPRGRKAGSVLETRRRKSTLSKI